DVPRSPSGKQSGVPLPRTPLRRARPERLQGPDVGGLARAIALLADRTETDSPGEIVATALRLRIPDEENFRNECECTRHERDRTTRSISFVADSVAVGRPRTRRQRRGGGGGLPARRPADPGGALREMSRRGRGDAQERAA